MAAGLDHLLSLTYRENIVDKERAWSHFEKFIRLVHKYIHDWQYVVTNEQQERGAYHFHLGVKGYQDVSLLRSLWRSVVGDGNIDVSYKKTAKGSQWKRNKLAQYLAKYIDKDMDTELNEKRFRASPGIVIPKLTMLIPHTSMHVITSFIRSNLLPGRLASSGTRKRHTAPMDGRVHGGDILK